MRYFTDDMDDPRAVTRSPEGGTPGLMSSLFSTYQIASMLHTTPADVVEWMQQGQLPFVRLPHGPIRVSEGGLRMFCKNRGLDADGLLSDPPAQTLGIYESTPKAQTPETQQAQAAPQSAIDVAQQDDTFRPPVDLSNDVAFLESFLSSRAPEPKTPRPQAQQRETADEPTYPSPAEARETTAPDPADTAQNRPGHTQPLPEPEPLARQVAQALLVDAVTRRATHLHVEPHWDEIELRARIDGVLQPLDSLNQELPEGLAVKIVASLMEMAQLDPDDSGPASASFTFAVEARDVRCDLSCLPTLRGRRMTLRLTDSARPVPRLNQLGLAREDEAQLRRIMTSACGLILVAGRAHSGRTTTLNAMVLELSHPQRSIITIEKDPEPGLDRFGQADLTTELDVPCSQAIQACCRQDPDVIMIQDLPDPDSVQAAVQAGRQGRLVLAGIDALSAPDALAGLSGMGIDAWTLSRSLLAVVVPRSVRKLCQHCRRIVVPEEHVLETMGLSRGDLNFPVFGPDGCEKCNHSGYQGRTGLFSLLEVDAAIAAAIQQGADQATIERTALQAGMRSLGEVAMKKVADAVTSIEEVSRVMPHELFVRSGF